MDQLTEDVLIQIFQEYLREKWHMPTFITPVCRRWYNTITATPILWSKVNIDLVSTQTFPKLIPPTSITPSGLETYLSRSEANGAYVPLHITIQWDASENPVRDHKEFCQHPWIESMRCGSDVCPYEDKCRELIRALFMTLAGISAQNQPITTISTSPGTSSSSSPQPHSHSPISQSPSRLKRWRTLALDFEAQTRAMCTEISFIPFDNPLYQASNLTGLTFKGLLSHNPGLHPQFAPNLQTVILADFERQWTLNLANVKVLTLTRSFGRSMPRTGKNWIEAPNVEKLRLSLPPNDVTLGIFPKLKSIHIRGSIGDILMGALEAGATAINKVQKLVFVGEDEDRYTQPEWERESAEQPRLENLTMRLISPSCLLMMSEGAYFTSAREIHFVMTLGKNKDGGPFSDEKARKTFVKALATFIWHCAEDTEILGKDKVADRLIAEARLLNEKED